MGGLRVPHRGRLDPRRGGPDRLPPPVQPGQRSLPTGPRERRGETPYAARGRRQVLRRERRARRPERVPDDGRRRRLHEARAPGPRDARARVPDTRRPRRGGRGGQRRRPIPRGEPQRRWLLEPAAVLGQGPAHAGPRGAGRHRRGFRDLPGLGQAGLHPRGARAQPRYLGSGPPRRRVPTPDALLHGGHPAADVPAPTPRALPDLRRARDTGPLLRAGGERRGQETA